MVPKGRVLVVDDDQDVCEVVEMMLAMRHYQVTCVGNHAAERFLIGPDRFDVILIDMAFPADVTARHAAMARSRGMQVVFTSAYLDYIGNPPADSPFLPKPFRGADLLVAIEAALSRG